jgi:hypothetical protein
MPASPAAAITVEKTPAYFTSALAPTRVYQMDRNVRILLIVRNPTTRTISDYSQVNYNKLMRNKTHEPFEAVVFSAEKNGALAVQ